MRVLVIGAAGMLGSAVAQALSSELDVTATTRREFDIDSDCDRLGELVRGHQWIVNATGIAKSAIGDRLEAIRVNSVFPYLLAQAADREGARVLQIATDGVFSGARGSYNEDDPHDANDFYGKTKSLGEVPSPAVVHLRCSIIGLEPGEPKFLLEWLQRQPHGATVQGFTNHRWNGITTLHFAKIAAGIVRGAAEPRTMQHVVPANSLSKAELLRELARAYDRNDLQIEDAEAPQAIDRTLTTLFPETNAALWHAAGHDQLPTIQEMILTIRPRDTSG